MHVCASFSKAALMKSYVFQVRVLFPSETCDIIFHLIISSQHRSHLI